ncbi:MAG: two-component system response regulator (stage 0 sporulation protein F) [Lysobacterales bacterium]|jgi:two-component system response regulator (stage 0 sporulation protein F)
MAKLLIVDDEDDIREFAKSFFTKRSIDVVTASGGAEALRMVNVEKPDLILLDITMEDMTGIEVLRKLRADKNDVKVIMVTGVEDLEVVNEANSWGVKGYVHKPLALDELEKVVMGELAVG